MKLEQQVTILELSQRLKELGYKQIGLWWWFEFEDNDWYIYNTCQFEDNNEHIKTGRRIVAPTCAELGEVLPELHTTIKERGKWTGIAAYKNDWLSVIDPYTESDTEANARASMLIYLLENKLMEVGE